MVYNPIPPTHVQNTCIIEPLKIIVKCIIERFFRYKLLRYETLLYKHDTLFSDPMSDP